VPFVLIVVLAFVIEHSPGFDCDCEDGDVDERLGRLPIRMEPIKVADNSGRGWYEGRGL
jgi:hypothetical protein